MGMLSTLLLAVVLQPNLNPSLGQLGVQYFDALNQSQIWINIEPQGPEPGPNPFRLNFTMMFPGRTLGGSPEVFEVRAEMNAGVFPTTIRQPILRFQLGDGIEIDLTAPGKSFQFISGCLNSVTPCAQDTVLVRLPFETMQRIAKSDDVKIDALGFTARLRPEDIQSLRKFIETVGNGVQIR
jgi:hypothetical protein